MNNLIFSLNATLPVFLVMLVGYFFKRRGLFGKEFVKQANTFNYRCTLPVLLFTDIAATNIRENWDSGYVLFCAGSTTVAFIVIWVLAKLFIKDRSLTGAFVQASYRSSAAVLGIAFIKNIYGTSGMAPLMIIGSVPLFNIYAVTVLTFEARNRDNTLPLSIVLKKTLLGIVTNPIIAGVFLGMLASFINLDLPVMAGKTLGLIGDMATPLALIAVGAGFEGRKALTKIKPTAVSALIKLVVLPAVFLTAAALLGIRDQKLVALIVLFGSPTTPSCYVMAQNLDGDTVLTGSCIVATTLLSSFTLTFWIFLMRSLSYIA